MKKKNLATLIAALVMALCLFAGCGAQAKNVPVADIAAAVDTALGKEDALTAVDDSYIKGYMKIDTSSFEEFTVKINAFGANIDEYGIFKAADSSQAKEIKTAVEAYLQLRLDTWMDEYMPEEKPKLTSAEVRTNGNYIMYCILSDSDKTAAFGAFDSSLK